MEKPDTAGPDPAPNNAPVSISVFFPCFNEQENVEATVDKARAVLESIHADYELIIVDDGSADSTGPIADDITMADSLVKVVHHPKNRGYGAAVRNGLRRCVEETDAEYIVCLHADGQYPPESVLPFMSHMAERGVDVLQGSRHKDDTALEGGMPKYKWLAGKILTWMENRTFGLEMTDYHSGFLVYSRRAASTIPFDQLSTYFDFDLEVIASARAQGLVVGELGIPTRYADEESHLNPIWYGLRCLRVMLRYRMGAYRPRLHP